MNNLGSSRQFPTSFHSLTDVFQFILAVIDTVIPVIVAGAVAVFLWGLFRVLRAAGNESDHTEGWNIMIYGLIGIFVMTAVWGLIAVLNGTFGFSGVSLPSTQ